MAYLEWMSSKIIHQAFCLILTSSALAQTSLPVTLDSLERGDRVRISIANLDNIARWRTGTLSELDDGLITIVEGRDADALTLPLREIDGIQHSLGRDTGRALRWIGGAAAFGFVVGAGLTLVSSDDTQDGSRGSWVTAGFGFGAISAVVGGILGFQEQWGDVVLTAAPGLSSTSDPVLRTSVRF